MGSLTARQVLAGLGLVILVGAIAVLSISDSSVVKRDRVLSGEYKTMLPFDWPMSSTTQAQYNEAMACDIEGGVRSHQLNLVRLEDLPADFVPQTTCDWAVMAAAYGFRAKREKSEIPYEGIQAFRRTVSRNPAYLLKSEIWSEYLHLGGVVEASPLADQLLDSLTIRYEFYSLGYESRATLEISKASTSPQASGLIYEGYEEATGIKDPPRQDRISGFVDMETVEALGGALHDLIPIQHPPDPNLGCADHSPHWEVILTYVDGTQASLLSGGGPWQVTIEGQTYLHFSDSIPEAIANLIAPYDFPHLPDSGAGCLPREGLLRYTYPDYVEPAS